MHFYSTSSSSQKVLIKATWNPSTKDHVIPEIKVETSLTPVTVYSEQGLSTKRRQNLETQLFRVFGVLGMRNPHNPSIHSERTLSSKWNNITSETQFSIESEKAVSTTSVWLFGRRLSKRIHSLIKISHSEEWLGGRGSGEGVDALAPSASFRPTTARDRRTKKTRPRGRPSSRRPASEV